MTEIHLMGPGGATEVKQDTVIAALNSLLTELTQKLEAGQQVALDAATLAALESVTATIANLPSDYPDAAALLKLDAILTALSGTLLVNDGHSPLTDTQLRAAPVPITALSLLTDNVRQTLRVSQPLSVTRTGPLTDDPLISVLATERIRLIRNAGHVDPALDPAVYPVVTLKLGTTVIYRDKLEAGLPWSETVCFEGAAAEPLTVSVDTSATIYLNIRYEVFPA